ncbi:MAG TPA: FHA domain-containing protein [Fimbriimonadaceae bacterium]|nr:FHA domain-containing protein [Fimbriimonadaceae bacterium]
MRRVLGYGLIGGFAGTVAALLGVFFIPPMGLMRFVDPDDRIDVRALLSYDKPYGFLCYFFLGAFVCACIAPLANLSKEPTRQFRSFLVGLLLGGALCYGGSALVDIVTLRMALGFDPNAMVTLRQYDQIHSVGFNLYYLVVPTSLAVALTIAVGISKFTLARGAISAVLAMVISGVIVHLALLVVMPFIVASVVNASDPTQIDLNNILRPALVAHLFGMGFGAAMAFAVAELVYKPAWLRGTSGIIEGRTFTLPTPEGHIGTYEGNEIRVPGDGSVAPIHALVTQAGESYDLRPVEGEVRVNGKVIMSHRLQDNDRIEIGTLRLQYRTRLCPSGGKVTPIELAKVVPAAPANPIIEIEDALGQFHRLRSGRNVLGREVGVDLAFPAEPTVSRRHAAIEISPTGFTIEDLGSSNGTFVNGQSVTTMAALAAGDEIRLGQCRLVLRVRA